MALIGIIVHNPEAVDELNSLLHEYSQYIIGRMGVPYRERGLSIISVALDAPNDTISALAGKLGMIEGVSSKTTFPKA
ncbi:MAG: iron-only hydrogenase system regulator [Coriobacteriia bacterium]|nr:iron-only hydrogenase system regulator [Coriobacteriia bacterium]